MGRRKAGFAVDSESARQAGKKGGKANSKKVHQLDLDGNIVATWPSTREAERQAGFQAAGISAVALGKRTVYKGFRWKYADADG